MITLMDKEYDGESIIDIERDVMECIDPDMNEPANNIEMDKHNLITGTIRVAVYYEEE